MMQGWYWIGRGERQRPLPKTDQRVGIGENCRGSEGVQQWGRVDCVRNQGGVESLEDGEDRKINDVKGGILG